jgi:hypothetical protein
MEDMLAKAMTMGGAGLGLAQKLMTSIRTDKPANEGKNARLPLEDLGDIPAYAAPTNGKVDPATV